MNENEYLIETMTKIEAFNILILVWVKDIQTFL